MGKRGIISYSTLILMIAAMILAFICAGVVYKSTLKTKIRTEDSSKELIKSVGAQVELAALYANKEKITDTNYQIISGSIKLGSGSKPIDAKDMLIYFYSPQQNNTLYKYSEDIDCSEIYDRSLEGSVMNVNNSQMFGIETINFAGQTYQKGELRGDNMVKFCFKTSNFIENGDHINIKVIPYKGSPAVFSADTEITGAAIVQYLPYFV